MRITDRLRVEHGVFLRQLRSLEDLLASGASLEALRTVVDVTAQAEVQHSELEEHVLFPALAHLLGPTHAALAAVQGDHERMRAITSRIRARDFAAEDVRLYVEVAREHFEREIHSLFVIAEELLSDAELSGMANWNVDHMFESTGSPAPWSRAGQAID
jgi:hemerythrin-like domain-containing protein